MGREGDGESRRWSDAPSPSLPLSSSPTLAQRNRRSKGIVGIVEQAGYLILPLRSYPAWSATVNGRPASTFTEPAHGLLAVPVTPGPVTVIVTWTTTRDVVAGRWITFLALVLLAVAFRIEWKTAPS